MSLRTHITHESQRSGGDGSGMESLRARVAERNRNALYQMVSMHIMDALGKPAIERHFNSMPEQYWVRVTDATLRWHLSLAHAFLRRVERGGSDAAPPVVRFRHDAVLETTEVAVCSWDRPGLLMTIAGALTQAGFTILKADIYTRADLVALDIFQVAEADGRHGAHEERVAQASRLLEASLNSADTVDVRSVPTVADRPEVLFNLPAVTVDNDASPHATVLRIEARDRIGLLFDILRAFSAFRLNVAQAIIATVADRATDVFYVMERNGWKILDPVRLDGISAHICRETCRNAGAGLPARLADLPPMRAA